MKPLKDYHHYKKDLIEPSDKIAKLERYMIDLLLNSNVADNERESSIAFELKHHHSTAQFARVLARKRNLPIDICTAGALLHDISAVTTGKYKDHAHLGTPMAEKILDEVGNFSKKEKLDILKIVYNHSDKQIWSEDPFEEFGKDVDVLDCFLYPNGFGYYLKYKPLGVFNQYIIRAKKIWEELNLPKEKSFTILDNYNENWFDYSTTVEKEELLEILNNEDVPSFCFYLVDGRYKIFSNKENWGNVRANPSKYEDNNDLLEIVKTKGNIILVWTAIDSYEVINANSNRINELGINKGDM